MKLKNCLIAVMFFTLFIFGCSNNPPPEANSGEVYATNVSFSLPTTNYFVDDEINLKSVSVKIEPSNATVKPKFTINDSNLGVINNDVLTLLGEGELSLTVSVLSDVNTYKTYTVKLNISLRPVYAEDVDFDKDSITVNLGDTAQNLLTILPSNYNKGVLVEYESGNTVNYNYLTGEITPIAAGTDTVTVIVNKSDTEIITKSFTVTVTNNIYATAIESLKINNKITSENITLFTGEQGVISSVVLPNEYNLTTTYSCSNSLISVNGNEFTVGNSGGECELICTVLTKNGTLTKSVTVTILPMLTKLDFNIKLGDNEVSELFVGTSYNAFITTILPDYSNITFTNCNYTYSEDNSYNITINSAGEKQITISYSISSFVGSYTITGSKTVFVYNPVTDINLSLQNVQELIPSGNVYTLYLPNTDMLSTAITNNELVFADVMFSAKNINTKPSALNLSVEGDSVVLNENRIIANKLGDSKLIVKSNDINQFSKEVTIKVLPLKATNIIAETEETLYLNGVNGYPSSFNLEYSVIPAYAYNTDVNVSCNSQIIQINSSVVTGVNEGTANITLTCDDVVKTIIVTVYYYETNLIAKLNGETISNNAVIELTTENTYYLQGEVYSAETKLNREVSCYINGEKVEDLSVYELYFTEEGNYNIKLKYNSLEVNFVANVILNNPIVSASFTNDNITVNMFETNTVSLDFEIVKTHQTKPTTSNYYFESDNISVANINGYNLEILSSGTAVISLIVDGSKLDELTVTVINKEINYISNLTQFLAISSKPNSNYVVTENLDFSSFTYLDSFNFAGEIDFNNKTITNLKTPMFNIVENTAVIKNVVISGTLNLDVLNYYNESTNPTAYYSLIAYQNNGVINNLEFKNFTLNLSNNSVATSTTLSLVTTTNNGVVSNVTLNNFVFNTNYKSTKVAGIIFSGLVNTNNGEITSVYGTASYSGFTRIAGVALYNYNSISTVTLTQVFNCTQSNHQIGALSYRVAVVNSVTPEISNINLTTTVNNSKTLSFAGFVYDTGEITVSQIKLSLTFKGDFDDETTFLIYKTSTSSSIDFTKFDITTSNNFDKVGA